ncbi:unnamed protein product [Coffea canephora]|uniref:Uncharacterized protein n=1 Tax=Coffea canephora TaxID=49390 RepID=A0A068UJH6_COFCA|nr:unnamed protein product [Coffea canephora]
MGFMCPWTFSCPSYSVRLHCWIFQQLTFVFGVFWLSSTPDDKCCTWKGLSILFLCLWCKWANHLLTAILELMCSFCLGVTFGTGPFCFFFWFCIRVFNSTFRSSVLVLSLVYGCISSVFLACLYLVMGLYLTNWLMDCPLLQHAYRDGRLEEVVLRHLGAEDGQTVIAKNIRLSDFLSNFQIR